MKCCGQERVTAFCPDCGRPIGGDPLTEILAHIRGLLSVAERTEIRWRQWDETNPARAEDRNRQDKRAAHERKIRKLKRWIEAIESA